MQSDDRQRFLQIYDALFDQIYHFIFRRVPVLQDTEDIVSETFTAVLINIGSLDPKLSPKPWVFRVARNKLNDYLRRKYRLEIAEFNEDAEIPEEQPPNNEKWLSIADKLINRLEKDDRNFIIMRYKEKLSYKELARHFGITFENAKVKNGRILKKLKKLWAQTNN
ncbi:MAG TPA: sigma-70 family RNA polymerase sigma factor [Patescibacteria group bacterium]|nr:sigma-70 family RNA polymerase sigma factor [Patescibacteria group bacterium]